jgi:hypothetical protein
VTSAGEEPNSKFLPVLVDLNLNSYTRLVDTPWGSVAWIQGSGGKGFQKDSIRIS